MRQFILVVIFVWVASFTEGKAQTKDGVMATNQVECESNIIHFRFAKAVVDSGSAMYPISPAPPYGFDATSQVIPAKTILSIPALSIRVGLTDPYITLPALYVPGGFDPNPRVTHHLNYQKYEEKPFNCSCTTGCDACRVF